MNEIRIKLKPFVMVVITLLILLFYLAFRNPDCQNFTSYTDTYQPQQVPQSRPTTSQPFTIYAITPTYARPVQKAELTR